MAKKKNTNTFPWTPMADTTLASVARDVLGFPFGALVRPSSITVMCRAKNPGVSQDTLTEWELVATTNPSVLFTQVNASSNDLVISVTTTRSGKDQKKDTNRALTDLAKIMPSFYQSTSLQATPLTGEEMLAYVTTSLAGTQDYEAGRHTVEHVNQVTIGERTHATFDSLYDAGLDELARALALNDTHHVFRTSRIFRPAKATAVSSGRYSLLLSHTIPTTQDESEEITHARLDALTETLHRQLSPVQRLHIHRLRGRQLSAVLATHSAAPPLWSAPITAHVTAPQRKKARK